jgi:hypothetical protein
MREVEVEDYQLRTYIILAQKGIHVGGLHTTSMSVSHQLTHRSRSIMY